MKPPISRKARATPVLTDLPSLCSPRRTSHCQGLTLVDLAGQADLCLPLPGGPGLPMTPSAQGCFARVTGGQPTPAAQTCPFAEGAWSCLPGSSLFFLSNVVYTAYRDNARIKDRNLTTRSPKLKGHCFFFPLGTPLGTFDNSGLSSHVRNHLSLGS